MTLPGPAQQHMPIDQCLQLKLHSLCQAEVAYSHLFQTLKLTIHIKKRKISVEEKRERESAYWETWWWLND